MEPPMELDAQLPVLSSSAVSSDDTRHSLSFPYPLLSLLCGYGRYGAYVQTELHIQCQLQETDTRMVTEPETRHVDEFIYVYGLRC